MASGNATIRPRLHHAPPSVAQAEEPLRLEASLEHAQLVRRAVLLLSAQGKPLVEVPFQRAATGPFVAVVPESEVRAPGLAYCIEIELLDGARMAVFASREALHEVEVPSDIADSRERALLTRLGDRRSVITTSGEFVYFGKTNATSPATGSTPASTQSIADQYYRVEAGYTYRLLGRVAEFGIRAGVVRGRSVVPDPTNPSKFDVGLNYGAPTVRLRAVDWLHIEGEFLTSVTEVGFSVGGGAAVLIGDPYGGKLTLGFESIQSFGTRAFSRVDIVAMPRLTLAPIIEITSMPHSAKTGVRLLTEARYELASGLAVSLRAGYQARDSASGGASAGAALAYAF
jgi:hypothetical protein